jgi:hypothetical protein
VLQTGSVPVHLDLFVAEHCPHAPLVSHAGLAPPQSLSPAQGLQEWVATLHTGAVPVQFALVRQATHLSDATSHTGVGLPQALEFVAEHWPHAPVSSQAGVAPPHSLSPRQARHVCVPKLHTGVLAPH